MITLSSESLIGTQEWEEIQEAVTMFRSGTTLKQVKGEGWTVYRTASCIRIDIATTNEGELPNA